MEQFQFQEFYNALCKLVSGSEHRLRCRQETKLLIHLILTLQYPYQSDDLEYLMDMVNYELRLTHYNGKKSRYYLGKALDRIVSNSVFYIEDYMDIECDRKNRIS